MSAHWRRGVAAAALAACILLCAGGALGPTFRSGRLHRALPAELIDLGPIWVGDFCRDNVAHRRFPPGWCPRDYILSVVLRVGERGSIHPILRIPAPELRPLGPETQPDPHPEAGGRTNTL